MWYSAHSIPFYVIGFAYWIISTFTSENKRQFFFFFFAYYSECTTTYIHKENEDNVRSIYFWSLTTKMKHERSTNNYCPRACLMLNLNSSCVIMMENVKTITDFLFIFFKSSKLTWCLFIYLFDRKTWHFDNEYDRWQNINKIINKFLF